MNKFAIHIHFDTSTTMMNTTCDRHDATDVTNNDSSSDTTTISTRNFPLQSRQRRHGNRRQQWNRKPYQQHRNDKDDNDDGDEDIQKQNRCHSSRRLLQHRYRHLCFCSRHLSLLVLLTVVIVMGYPILVLYGIYKSETLPSPFLVSRTNTLSTPQSQRGVPPPSSIFVFPTVEERILFYMGHWASEKSNTTLLLTTNETTNTTSDGISDHVCTRIKYWQYPMPEIGSPYRFTAANLQQLIRVGWQYRLPWRPQRSHPGDAYLYHFRTVDGNHDRIRNDDNINDRQMILQFGDGKDSANFLSTPFPIMVKTRLSQPVYDRRFGKNSKNNDQDRQRKHSFPPIIGMYEIHRHYNDHFYETEQLWDEIPWSSKHTKLVWRGSSSGKRKDFVVPYMDNNDNDNDRNRIDIGFSEILRIHQNKFPNPDSYYIKDELSIRQLLQHKYLLVLEGWGMASSLKWMLYSNSVVFMVPPTKVSWAMEDKLIPYVHYVPVDQNYSNLHDQVEWAMSNDDEVYQIMLQSRHYMESLVTSPQAQSETIQILNRMDQLYQQNFGSILQNCPTP